MSGEELMELYFCQFGVEPPVLTTVSTENETYKEMIGYCNIMGTPVTDEIVVKFFGKNYDLITEDKPNFKQFKKPN